MSSGTVTPAPATAVESIATIERHKLPARRVHGVVRRGINPFTGYLGTQVRCQPRTPELEKDPTHKQLTAYVVCVCAGSSGELLILSYVRGKKGAEPRLHAKKSIGVGGHINHDDFVSADAAVRAQGVEERTRQYNYTAAGCLYAAAREVNEELLLSEAVQKVLEDQLRFYGLVNCDGDQVSSVHIGVVYVCQFKEVVTSSDLELLNPTWFTIDELVADIQAYEPWSQHLIGSIAGAIAVDRVLFTEMPRSEESL